MIRPFLFLVIIIAVAVRLAYIGYAGAAITIEPDSQGYYSTDNYFNINRLPGYAVTTSLFLPGHPQFLSREFYRGAWNIILLQTVVGVLGLIVLYDLLCATGITDRTSLLFTAFTALNIYQFIWEHAFLTHALFITMVTVILRLFVSLLKKPTARTGIVFIIASAYAFLLRPAGLGIPFILLPLVWLRHRTKNTAFLILALLCLFAAVPLSHIVMNRYLYQFKGMSINTDFGIFGRILKFNIPIQSAKSVSPLYGQVKEYQDRGGNISIPWYFFVAYNNQIYTHMDQLQEFDRLVLRHKFGTFLWTVVRDIPKAFADTYVSGVLYRGNSPGITRVFVDTLAFFYASLQKMSILFLVLFPLSILLYIKKQTILHTFLLAIGLVEIYQLVSTLTYGGSWDMAGHMITTQTYLFFFCFWWIRTLFSWIKKRV